MPIAVIDKVISNPKALVTLFTLFLLLGASESAISSEINVKAKIGDTTIEGDNNFNAVSTVILSPRERIDDGELTQDTKPDTSTGNSNTTTNANETEELVNVTGGEYTGSIPNPPSEDLNSSLNRPRADGEYTYEPTPTLSEPSDGSESLETVEMTALQRDVYQVDIEYQAEKEALVEAWFAGELNTSQYALLIGGENAFYVSRQLGGLVGYVLRVSHLDDAIEYAVWKASQTKTGKVTFELINSIGSELAEFGENHQNLRAVARILTYIFEVTGVRAIVSKGLGTAKHFTINADLKARNTFETKNNLRFTEDYSTRAVLSETLTDLRTSVPVLVNDLKFGKGMKGFDLPNAFDPRFPEFKPKLIPLKQLTRNDCGPACAKLALEARGIIVSRSRIAGIQGAVLSDVSSLLHAIKILDPKGGWAGGILSRQTKLSEIPLPAIAVLKNTGSKYDHAVLLEWLSKKGAILIDPGSGKRMVLPVHELMKLWDGRAIVRDVNNLLKTDKSINIAKIGDISYFKNKNINWSFYRPEGIPASWKAKASKDKKKSDIGVIFQHPDNPHHSIRIMPPKPLSPEAGQRRPYVIMMAHGNFYDKNGNVLPTHKMKEAHIPLQEFIFKPELYE